MAPIGIVVTTFNTSRYLAETIQSVLAQTLTDWALVVVDDGSQDGSADLAERLLRAESRARVVRTTNQGVAHARNRGVAELPAELRGLAVLDSDDVWEPEALQTLSQALEASSEACVAVAGWARYIGPEGAFVTDPNDPLLAISARDGWRRPDDPRTWAMERSRLGTDGRVQPLPFPEPTDLASLLADNRIVSPGVALLRAEPFRSVGGFRQVASPREDWDLWIRLAPCGHIQPVDVQVLRYRVHGANASLNMHSSRLAQRAIEQFVENWAWLRSNDPELLASWRKHRRAMALGEALHRGRLIRSHLAHGRLALVVHQLEPLLSAIRHWVESR